MSSEMSETRLYLGNLPRQATKKDVEDFFNEHGHGSIQEVKLMNGFGFIEYSNPNDARDIVPDGKEFMDSRLTVQFARGPRPPRHEFNAPMGERGERPPRPRRTTYRMNIAGLPTDTSWQDLKDFARKSGVDVVFSEVSRNRDGAGTVEFETADDLRLAINKLDDYEFKGVRVSCTADENRGGRGRSRSPPMRGGRNFSPRGGRGGGGHSPRGGRGNYSPPPRGDHRNDRGFRDRSPYGGGGGGGGGRDYRRGGDYRGDRRRNSPPRGGNSGGGPQDDHYSGTRNNAGGGGGGNRGNYDDNSAPRGNRYNRDDDFRGGRGGYGGGGGGGNNYGGPRGGGGGGGGRNDNNDNNSNNNTNNTGGGGRPSPPSRNRDDDYGHRQRSDRY